MSSSIIDFVSDNMKPKLKIAAFVCAAIYGPWYLRSYKAQYAVQNDLAALKTVKGVGKGLNRT